MKHDGQRATWLLVGALSALALAAVADSLVPWTRPEPRAPEFDAGRRALARALRVEGVGGLLFFSDDRCRLRALRLPNLNAVEAPEGHACSFSISPEGTLSFGDADRQPGGPFTAWCREGWVELAARSDAALPFTRLYRLRGCSPAWKPDGTLTYVRDGEVVELETRCGTSAGFCTNVLLLRADIARALRRSLRPREPHSYSISDLAWLGNRTVAVLARSRPHGDRVVALFRRASLVAVVRHRGSRLSRLSESPGRNYLAAVTDGSAGIVLFDRALRPVSLPPSLATARAVAWSPDERWTALAGARGIHLLRTGVRIPRPIRLPIVASDVAWQ